MLHTHFKRVVLGRLATCCVRGVFNSFLLIHGTALHYKSLAELRTGEQCHRKTFPYLPSTTFSTHNDGLVHRVHLLLDIPVGLLSHCKDVRFQILSVEENIHISEYSNHTMDSKGHLTSTWKQHCSLNRTNISLEMGFILWGCFAQINLEQFGSWALQKDSEFKHRGYLRTKCNVVLPHELRWVEAGERLERV